MLLHNSIYAIIALTCTAGQESPLIKLTTGEVRGYYKRSCKNRTYSAFEGIPYAKPPLGPLRFVEAQPAQPWTGIWNATEVHTCIQMPIPTDTVIGNEDCLYINVYVPREKPIPNENLDVVVHIHGGAFIQGNPDMFGPHCMIDRDIVYVNFNYRLGILGFLSTEDEVVPGNNGMKDQVLALKWVQGHIARFGGNPKSVTLVGMSAGGTSAYFHYFSPLSKGLFHRGITQGSSIDVIRDALPKTLRIAASVNCCQAKSRELVECLREKSAAELVRATMKLFVLPGLPVELLGPVVERNSSNPFLPDYPYNLLLRGELSDLPWLVSRTTEEGGVSIIHVLKYLDFVNDNWYQLAPDILEYGLNMPKSEQDLISWKVRQFYFENDDISIERVAQIVNMFTDRFSKFDSKRYARLQAKINKSPVYSYNYGYRAADAVEAQSRSIGVDLDLGVGHCADGYFLYNMKIFDLELSCVNITSADETIKELLLDIVKSFAEKGYPEVEGIQWEPVSGTGDFKCLFIKGPGDVRVVHQKEMASRDLWGSILTSRSYSSNTNRSNL